MKICGFLLTLILHLSVFAQESAFDETNTLSESEEVNAQNYIHQGIAQEKYLELCADQPDKYKDICTNNDSAYSGGTERALEVMIPAVTKVYTMIMGFSGSGFTANTFAENGLQEYKVEGKEKLQTFEDGNPPEGATPNTEQKKDYCSYVAMGAEAVGIAYMTLQNEKTEQNYVASKPEARQAAAFYTLADTHKSLSKSSKTQGALWGTVTGCYAAMLATMNISGDWKIYAKLAGSTLITAFHLKKAKAHEERAKKLTAMAKELPQAGDCNPHTNTTCFCNEDSSFTVDPANFRKYCVPSQLAARSQNNDAFVCLDQKNKTDEDCTCAKNNTCIDRVLKLGAMDFGVSPIAMKNPLSGINPLSKGFGTSGLDSATKANLAMGKKALEAFKPSKIPSLSDKEKKVALELSKQGVPKAAAAFIAKSKPNGNVKLPTSLTAALDNNSVTKKSAISNNQRIKNDKKFSRGKNVGSSKSRTRQANPYSRYKKKNTNNTSGLDIQDFAQEAHRKAEIVQDNSKGIFDIISYRYKSTAWKKFPNSFKSQQNEIQEQR